MMEPTPWLLASSNRQIKCFGILPIYPNAATSEFNTAAVEKHQFHTRAHKCHHIHFTRTHSALEATSINLLLKSGKRLSSVFVTESVSEFTILRFKSRRGRRCQLMWPIRKHQKRTISVFVTFLYVLYYRWTNYHQKRPRDVGFWRFLIGLTASLRRLRLNFLKWN